MVATHRRDTGERLEPIDTARELYLDLMKRCLTRQLFLDGAAAAAAAGRPAVGSRRLLIAVWIILYRLHSETVRRLPAVAQSLRPLVVPLWRALKRWTPIDPAERAEGMDWPADAETMIGMARLDNIQDCVTDVLRRGIPGDLIETGVWRGGATIFMRAILKAYGNTERLVWVADSFRGLPKPDLNRAPADAGDIHWAYPQLAVPLERVQANFARYGLLDRQVRFLAGWFMETLPSAPIQRLAVARLDGDMYGSTMDALRALYPKLSIGGYLIVDDYGAVAACRAAVDEYRLEHGITEELQVVDRNGVFWQRLR